MESPKRKSLSTLTKPRWPPRICCTPKPERTPNTTLAVARDGLPTAALEACGVRKRSSYAVTRSSLSTMGCLPTTQVSSVTDPRLRRGSANAEVLAGERESVTRDGIAPGR